MSKKGLHATSPWFLLALFVGLGVYFSIRAEAGLLPSLPSKIELPKKDTKPDAESPSKPPKGEESKKPAYTGPKKRLAVMDLEVKITTTASTEPTTTGGLTSTTSVYLPPPSDFGAGLTEMLTTALVETNRFILVERKALADIQAEHQLAQSGAVEPSSAPMYGKLLRAQALVRGAVTEYTYRKSSTGGSASLLKGVGLAASKAEAAVVIDVRLYDTTTGQVIDSVKAEGRAKSSAAAVDVQTDELNMSASGFNQSPLGQASRQAIERAVAFIVQRMEEVPWEGRIAEIDTDESGNISTIYINAGANAGLKIGDTFQIFQPGRDIVDPETKLVIGRTKDKLIGSCKVELVTKDLAHAVPIEGSDFKIGYLVRYVKPEKPKQ